MTNEMPEEIWATHWPQNNELLVACKSPLPGNTHYTRTDTIPQWNKDMDAAPRDGMSVIVYDYYSDDKMLDGLGLVVARYNDNLGWHTSHPPWRKLTNPKSWVRLPQPPEVKK